MILAEFWSKSKIPLTMPLQSFYSQIGPLRHAVSKIYGNFFTRTSSTDHWTIQETEDPGTFLLFIGRWISHRISSKPSYKVNFCCCCCFLYELYLQISPELSWDAVLSLHTNHQGSESVTGDSLVVSPLLKDPRRTYDFSQPMNGCMDMRGLQLKPRWRTLWDWYVL